MSTFGYNTFRRVGKGIQVSADGSPRAKAGGITVEWATVSAAASDYEVRGNGEPSSTNFLSIAAPADDYVYTGEKFLRYGQVMCKIVGGTSDGKYAPYGASSGLGGGALSKARGDMYILNASVHENDPGSDHPAAIEGGLVWKYRLIVNYNTIQTITMTATGGTFTISYKGQTTSSLAYNASAGTVQAALEALSTIGTGKVTVSLNSSVYTITVSPTLGDQAAFTVATGSLTGGSATVASPADTAAGPTSTEFNAAFPNIRFVSE